MQVHTSQKVQDLDIHNNSEDRLAINFLTQQYPVLLMFYLLLCLGTCNVHGGQERTLDLQELEVMHDCELSCVYWEWDLGFLEKQPPVYISSLLDFHCPLCSRHSLAQEERNSYQCQFFSARRGGLLAVCRQLLYSKWLKCILFAELPRNARRNISFISKTCIMRLLIL